MDMAGSDGDDPVMIRIREWFAASDWTLQTLGERMGYGADTARKSAHQFMRTKNPTIMLLRRFSEASGIPLPELVTDAKPKKGKSRPLGELVEEKKKGRG